MWTDALIFELAASVVNAVFFRLASVVYRVVVRLTFLLDLREAGFDRFRARDLKREHQRVIVFLHV